MHSKRDVLPKEYTSFQTQLAKEVAKGENRVRELAKRYEAAISMVRRWAEGKAKPRKLMVNLILSDLKREALENAQAQRLRSAEAYMNFSRERSRECTVCREPGCGGC